MKLILGSSSPRRRLLLEQLQLDFEVRSPDADESIITTTDPLERVRALAELKASHLPLIHPEEVCVTADTVVSFNQEIFEKPQSKEEARYMLQTLSGTTHHVSTGVFIRSMTQTARFVETTSVTFFELSDADIAHYIQSGEPFDKAGGYGIQSLGARFVSSIHGDYYNVVGLPIGRLMKYLNAFEQELEG